MKFRERDFVLSKVLKSFAIQLHLKLFTIGISVRMIINQAEKLIVSLSWYEVKFRLCTIYGHFTYVRMR